MRAKPSSADVTTATIAITGAFWLPLGDRFWRSRGSHPNALRSAIVLLLTLLAFSLNASSPSYAAALTVCTSGCNFTKIADAITASNAGDTISIQDAVHNEGNITVSKNLTIKGQSAASTAVDGGASGSVFVINGGVTATIQDMTIRNGSNFFGGGGIENFGRVTIRNSTLSGNSAGDGGGGILNDGTATISDSTFSGNSGGFGGGILNNGTATVINSTLSGNGASGGGGIFNEGTVTMSNSTLSGNSAGDAGGIENDFGTATISNSTLSGNSGTFAGGIFSFHGTATVKNSIIGNSPSGGNCNGLSAALGANLSTDGSCGTTNFTQVTSAQLNLGPLALNPPGATATQALLPGSVAIDAAPDCTDVFLQPVTTDQRGVPRPDSGESACDIGAFEFVDVPLSKSDCKDDKWQLWTNPPFKNQGQCIKFVNHN